ncbi:hypothetical protein SNE40_009802 [Patella caerulea]|uniref:Uncharacterized protein n=1 Tax=Patella caerulea TaxID=87958 RepID=A0AAN8JU27_PATCE
MGLDIAVWRMHIGMYRHRVFHRKSHIKSLRISSLTISVFLIISTCLVLSGDVETNPGPSNTRQGQISKSGDIIFPEKEATNDLIAIIQSLKKDIADLRSEVKDLNIKEEVQAIKEDIKDIKSESVNFNLRLDNQENRIRQHNLIFYGLKEKDNFETKSDCEQLIKEVLINDLKLDDHNSVTKFERIYRLGVKKNSLKRPRPVLVVFTSLSDRDSVLRTAKRELIDSQIAISEDFTERVRRIRKALIPFLIEAKTKDKKRARLNFDKLIIESKAYTIDLDTNQLIRISNDE